MAKNLTWREAIIEVLKANGEPMHYTDIAAKILELGLKKDVGATPAATVSADISISIKRDGENSPFEKAGQPGLYKLKQQGGITGIQPIQTKPDVEQIDGDNDTEEEAGIIRCLGMFWRRDFVDWKNNPKMWGRNLQDANQISQADPVDFYDQCGIYILYDRTEVVYVGRACPGLIGVRLRAHTSDRLNGRWDRFSWFGLLQVKSNGQLEKWISQVFTQEQITATLEALLIEGLEPKQNRQGGKNFRAIEYIQVEDPNLKKKKRAEFLAELIANNQPEK